jgi:hypothetical protein
MKSLRTITVLVGAAALTAVGMSAASASPTHALTCSGGNIASGTYKSITVTGACKVPNGRTVVVQHNVLIQPGAKFDAQTHSTVTIKGNVIAQSGSSFGLGCTTAHPCDGDMGEPDGFTTHDSVWGSVILNDVFNAALNGDHIGHNVIVNGGGAGLLNPETDFVPLSIKDDTIGGNVIVNGLTTVWFGVIRSTIGGNVVITGFQGSDPDSNEVVANTIGGNLICIGNSPAAQFGDAVEDGPPGYGPNDVAGHAIGECADLV